MTRSTFIGICVSVFGILAAAISTTAVAQRSQATESMAVDSVKPLLGVGADGVVGLMKGGIDDYNRDEAARHVLRSTVSCRRS